MVCPDFGELYVSFMECSLNKLLFKQFLLDTQLIISLEVLTRCCSLHQENGGMNLLYVCALFKG